MIINVAIFQVKLLSTFSIYKIRQIDSSSIPINFLNKTGRDNNFKQLINSTN